MQNAECRKTAVIVATTFSAFCILHFAFARYDGADFGKVIAK